MKQIYNHLLVPDIEEFRRNIIKNGLPVGLIKYIDPATHNLNVTEIPPDYLGYKPKKSKCFIVDKDGVKHYET